jgi:hypothetical protein
VSEPRVSETGTLLRLLYEAEIEFVVVGMTAAVLLGVPTTTQDLDVVHRRTNENIERLMATLARVGAYDRYDMARRLAPDRAALAGKGHVNLQTIHGPLDLLCTVDNDLGFEELLPHTTVVEDGQVSLRVLDLPTLIEIKQRAARPKDKLAIPLLLATLDERRRRGDD